MATKKKLYTVNEWNKIQFGNAFDLGGAYNAVTPTFRSVSPNINYDYIAGQASRWQPSTSTLQSNTQGTGSNIGKYAGAAATALSPGITSLISDGYSTGGVGEGISTVGNAVGDIANAIPIAGPLAGAIIKTGSAVLGGLTNRAFGTKKNEKNINTINQNVALAQNVGTAMSGATTTNDLLNSAQYMTGGTGFGTKDLVKGGWFSKSKARKKGQKYLDTEAAALSFQNNALQAGASNVDRNIDNTALTSFAAFGGLLDYPKNARKWNHGLGGVLNMANPWGNNIGSLNLMQNNDYIDAINNRTNAMYNSKNGMSITGAMNAFGGELGTNGTDWTNGLTFIDEGKSHEENPYGGVQVGVDPEGTPNLVEEGETIYNDYVFSDRMKVPEFMYNQLGIKGAPKDGISYAKASKKLAKESEERPNDPISLDGLDAAMSKLAMVQETERLKKQVEEQNQFAYGGEKGNVYEGWGDVMNFLGLRRKKSGAEKTAEKAKKGLDRAIDKTISGAKNAWNNTVGGLSNVGESILGAAGFERIPSQEELELEYERRVAAGEPWDKVFKEVFGIDSNTVQREEFAPGSKSTSLSETEDAVTSSSSSSSNTSSSSSYRTSGSKSSTTGFRGTPWTLGEYLVNQIKWQQEKDKEFNEKNKVKVTDIKEALKIPDLPTGLTEKDKAKLDEVYNNNIKRYQQNNPLPHYDTWMRYAPAVGAGIMTLTDLLGLTNKPDYSSAEKLEAAANAIAQSGTVSYDNPLGNYIQYRPMDITYGLNQLAAQSRATDRAIQNTAGTRGAATNAMIANGYNSQLAQGNLYRQALEYNDALQRQAEEFNRGTDQFNAQMGLEAALANARYRQAGLQARLSGLAQAAAIRDSIDKRVGASRSANITNLLNSLGNIGRENFAFNQINSTAAANNGYGYGNRGGDVTHSNTGAKGGKLRKKNKR